MKVICKTPAVRMDTTLVTDYYVYNDQTEIFMKS